MKTAIERFDIDEVLAKILTIDDLFKMSLDAGDVFATCTVADGGSDDLKSDEPKCVDAYNIETSLVGLNSLSKCFTLSTRGDITLDYFTVQRAAGAASGFTSIVTLGDQMDTRTNEVSVVYQQPHVPATLGYYKPLAVTNASEKVFRLTYASYHTERMEVITQQFEL